MIQWICSHDRRASLHRFATIQQTVEEIIRQTASFLGDAANEATLSAFRQQQYQVAVQVPTHILRQVAIS